MNQVSDIELIRDCQLGRKSSFRTLVDRYKDRVYTTVFRMVRNVHDAEDIAQEAFIATYKAMGSFDLDRKFAPWLMKIAANLAIDHLRRKQPRSVSLDSLGNAELQQNAGQLESVEASELQRLTERAIAQLPPKYRAAVVLYYTEGFTYGEVADTLDLPVGTVKTYLHRGREILKRRLKGVLSESVKCDAVDMEEQSEVFDCS